jgi:hypothetical protein
VTPAWSLPSLFEIVHHALDIDIDIGHRRGREHVAVFGAPGSATMPRWFSGYACSLPDHSGRRSSMP